MAKKRMFNVDIATTDKFYNLSMEAQALYFQLGLQADDDGFLDRTRSILMMLGIGKEVLTELVENDYLIDFGNGIYCITHWRINNNKIRASLYTPTMYQKEYNMLIDESNRPYRLKPLGDASDNEEQQQEEQESTDQEQEQAPLPWDNNTPNKANQKISINRNWLYNYWLNHNKETTQVVNALLKDGYNPQIVTAYRNYIKQEFEKYKH